MDIKTETKPYSLPDAVELMLHGKSVVVLVWSERLKQKLLSDLLLELIRQAKFKMRWSKEDTTLSRTANSLVLRHYDIASRTTFVASLDNLHGLEHDVTLYDATRI